MNPIALLTSLLAGFLTIELGAAASSVLNLHGSGSSLVGMCVRSVMEELVSPLQLEFVPVLSSWPWRRP